MERVTSYILYLVFQKHEISIWYPTSIWRFRENNVVSLPYQQQQQVAPRAPILIRQFVIVEDFYIDLPPVDEANQGCTCLTTMWLKA